MTNAPRLRPPSLDDLLLGKAELDQGKPYVDVVLRLLHVAPSLSTGNRDGVLAECDRCELLTELCFSLFQAALNRSKAAADDRVEADRTWTECVRLTWAVLYRRQSSGRSEWYETPVADQVFQDLYELLSFYGTLYGQAEAQDALRNVLWDLARDVAPGTDRLVLRATGLELLSDGSPRLPPYRLGTDRFADVLGVAEDTARRHLQVNAPETHAEATDDDRAGIHRLKPSVDPDPKPPVRKSTPKPAPLTLVVWPRLDHLPRPSTYARDRGDSPRALCESVVEVALPLSPTPDPKAFADRLRAAYPWALEVIELYATDLAGAPFAAFRPRVLVGGAGGGKTSFARAVLRAAGLPETLYSAAGQMDGGSFAGTSRQWGTWRMSVSAQAILRARCASVGIIVDEIEKAGPSRRWGRLDETILPFLERGTTARAIHDPAVEAALDLSGVSYVLTANDTLGLSGPLLDRAPVVHWPMPRREDLSVVSAAILAEIRREQDLDERWLPALDGNELDALSAWRGGSMRPLRRMVETVVAARDGFARRQPN